MINETSPISEIAIEAKDTSDDVRQISMSIEASCKHVDHSVTSMKLSDVPKFIDDFPMSGIDITPGMVGYGVDTKGIEYDVSNIFEKLIYDVNDILVYSGLKKVPSTYTEMYMFSDNRIVQRSSISLLFSDNEGDQISSVEVSSIPSSAFMYHGSFYGETDLYLVGIVETTSNSKYNVSAYNSSGELVFKTFLQSVHYRYYDLSFDGKYFYVLSSMSSGDSVRTITKYNLDGNSVDSFKLPSNNFSKISCTSNYVFACMTSASKPVAVNKDFSDSSEFLNFNSSGTSASLIVPMYGLDCVVVTYEGYTASYDLTTSTLVYHGQYTNAKASYFGSYVLLLSSGALYILDQLLTIKRIALPNLVRTYTNIASNGDSVAFRYVLEKHLYDNKAVKQLVAKAQKRG